MEQESDEHCTLAGMADWVSFGDKAFHEIGTFEYMPQKFHGIDTRSLGFASPDDCKDQHPFFKLKEVAATHQISQEDRMQAVRFMCYIPYRDAIVHCLEACKAIVFDESIDIYARYSFFSNNEKHFKLSDEIVHLMHPVFWARGVENGWPFDLCILSARYIMGNYHAVDEIRQNVLDWLLDIADDANETGRCRAEAADVMITCGEWDEVEWAQNLIKTLGGGTTLWNNSENVHDEEIGNSVRGVIRALRSKWAKDDIKDITVEDSYKLICGHIKSSEDEEKLRSFLFRIMTDSTKFETLTMVQILALVYKTIITHPSKEELSQRLFEEALESVDTCTTGFVTRLVNVLQGFVEGREFSLRISPKDELRSVVFARLNAELRNLPVHQRDAVLESMTNEEDKSAIDEFLFFFDLSDILWDEYKELMNRDDFDALMKQTYAEYAGKQA